MSNFDANKFKKELQKECERVALLEAKQQVRKKVTAKEFQLLKFKFDWGSSTVTVSGPDEITDKIK